jgi:hypothetical protein
MKRFVHNDASRHQERVLGVPTLLANKFHR